MADRQESIRERLEREREQKRQLQLEKYNIYKTEITKAKVQSVRQRINNGEILFLYQSVYLPVDSMVVNEKTVSQFSVKALRPLGFDGWDIVGIVPKTLGIGLQNTSFGSSTGTTWGAGVGGNIVGVYVLLKKEVSAKHDVSGEFLEQYVAENIFEFATEAESQILLEILSTKSEDEVSIEDYIDISSLDQTDEYYYKQGLKLMQNGSYEEAKLEFLKAIRVSSSQGKWYSSSQARLIEIKAKGK